LNNQEMTMPARPLSPHLSVYQFAYTMALSITHRIAGVALSLGLLLLAAWLLSAAAGPDSYAATVAVLSHWIFRVLLVGWLAAFLYHFANGIRHLLWDVGVGLEKAQARRSATVVVVAAVLALAICLYALFGSRGGAL
jgi:succinate dehydrogenase / fumarate reductase cytochrome b subunit